MLPYFPTFIHTITYNALFTPLYQMFCLFFKICLGFHILQEAFLDVVVLKYVQKIFDTSRWKLIPLPSECGLVIDACS